MSKLQKFTKQKFLKIDLETYNLLKNIDDSLVFLSQNDSNNIHIYRKQHVLQNVLDPLILFSNGVVTAYVDSDFNTDCVIHRIPDKGIFYSLDVDNFTYEELYEQ